ncbi:MAG TPA: hypothetical protein PLE42_11215 [Candidatus Competibacteraceae bacterium]|nr:MAG: hypothetical protein EKK69_05495 [Candidatus Competibacteraceae bacterium]HQC73272.1 hypothetical protein [Candidatus Competibacteraceae bacterium]
MKRFAILAAAALLGATSYANAETVLSGPQMDQISAGLFGLAITEGMAIATGDIGSLSTTNSVSGVNLLAPNPIAYSATASAAIATGFLGAVAGSQSASGSELGN